MSRRDNLLLSGGILIGFGMGLCVGVALLFVSVALLFHHMFVMGIQWPRLLLFTLVPLAVVLVGGLLLQRARRVKG